MVGARAQLIGTSRSLRAAKAPALRVAPTTYSVVIYGESGTGKELLARLIHECSSRADGPFVAINCGAIPRELAESDMFGQERGAFTGAGAARMGCFERAHGGTLFLDEIGELPLEQQVKILRVLQEGEILPVGAARPRHVDVRIISATNRNLWEMVQEGKFREDLFYRLAGFEITLPPLRDRDRDVIALAKMILEREEDHRGKRLSRGAERLLLEYPWPGNIRELQNVIRRAALYSIRGRIPEEAVRGALRFPVARVLTADELRRRILELVRGHRRIMESALRAELGTSRHRNLQILEELERNGLIDRHGTGSGTYYTAVDAVGRHDLSRRQRIALEHARTTGSITCSEYQRLAGATERSARRELADLVARGLLRVCGRGRTCRYKATTS